MPSPLACFAALLGGFPAGVRGLVVAGLLAAAMSSIDSGLHSCATAFVKDFIKSSQGHGTDEGGRAGVLAGRGAMLVFGVATVALAFLVGRLGTVFEIANKVVNGVGGPLLAVFLLGMFSRRANAAGVLAGGIIGVAWSAFVVLGVRDLALHYYAVANFAGTLALCYVLSLLAARVGARGSAAATKWTWWERMRPGIKPV